MNEYRLISVRIAGEGEGNCTVCPHEMSDDGRSLVYPDRRTYVVTFEDPTNPNRSVFSARYCDKDLVLLARELVSALVELGEVVW